MNMKWLKRVNSMLFTTRYALAKSMSRDEHRAYGIATAKGTLQGDALDFMLYKPCWM